MFCDPYCMPVESITPALNHQVCALSSPCYKRLLVEQPLYCAANAVDNIACSTACSENKRARHMVGLFQTYCLFMDLLNIFVRDNQHFNATVQLATGFCIVGSPWL